MIRRTFLSLSLLAFVVGCSSDTPPRSEPTSNDASNLIAFRGAAIWDGTGSATRFNENLIVRDGRIEGYSDSIPDGATIVDLGGRWVVPGFVNAHGHVADRWGNDDDDTAARVTSALELYARYGVTSILSLGGAPPESFSLRELNDDASLAHARFKVAGAVVADTTPEAAAATTQENIDAGVDWIKIRVDDNLGAAEKMPWPAVQAVFDTANKAGLPIATHIFYEQDAQRLLTMGTDLIAHSVRDQPASDEFLAAMLEAEVCYVPTLVREVSTFVYAERPDFFDDPFFIQYAKASEIERVSDPEFMQRVADSPAAAGYQAALDVAKNNLRRMLLSGIPVAYGTDSGPAGRFPGYFEHMEFDLMADAGMTPREILLSATSVAADCVNFDDVGTLENGKWADFVVLTDNPLQDLAALHGIEAVYVAGNEVEQR